MCDAYLMPQQPKNVTDDEIVTLPWWKNPLNFIAVAVAMLIFGVGIGYYFGHNAATPAHNAVDEGFLQDMRYHHDQAVAMAYHYRTSTVDPVPLLSVLAEEILLSQQLESGRMVQMLRSFGVSEVNDTGKSMGWMGHIMAIEDMDGLASQSELDAFAAASGDDASRIFATLMLKHHQGGVAMATYAVDHASNRDVIKLAQSIIKGQSGEIVELQKILDSLS